MDEQFWGRAARASSDSKESGRLFNFAAKSWCWQHRLSLFLDITATRPNLGGASRLMPEFALQFRLTQNVPLRCRLDFVLRGTGLQPQLAVEGIQPEEVAVRFTGRRARPPIADAFEIVPALACAVGQLINLWNVFLEARCIRRKII